MEWVTNFGLDADSLKSHPGESAYWHKNMQFMDVCSCLWVFMDSYGYLIDICAVRTTRKPVKNLLKSFEAFSIETLDAFGGRFPTMWELKASNSSIVANVSRDQWGILATSSEMVTLSHCP